MFQILNPLGLAYLSAFLMGGTVFIQLPLQWSWASLWGGLHREQNYILCLIFLFGISLGRR